MLTSYEHFMDYFDDEQAPKKSVAHHGWKKNVILVPNQAFYVWEI